MGVNEVEADMLRATGEPKRKKGEDYQDYARRLCDALNNMSDKKADAAYNKMKVDSQAWYNKATNALDEGEEVLPFPGDEEDEPAADESEEEDAEVAEAEEDEDAEAEEDEDEGEPETAEEDEPAEEDDEPGEEEAEAEEEGDGEEGDGYGDSPDGDEITEPEEEVKSTQTKRTAPRRAAPQRATAAKSTDRRPVKRTETKPVAASRKPAPAPARRESSSGGMDSTDLLCLLVIKNPKATTDELVEKVRAKGKKASDNLASQVKNIGAKFFRQLNQNGYKAPKV